MKKENSLLLASAILGLVAFNSAHAESTPAKEETVLCHGVNSCKGTGSCAGKIDACNSKDGCNAELKCAGQNTCKGKGLIKLSKKECLSKGGKVATK